jgi:hypothetical protein
MSWIKDKILKGDRGLGDTVERITKSTGIKNLVDKISEFTGKDCGCKARKKLLNKMFSYNSLSKDEQSDLDRLIHKEKTKDDRPIDDIDSPFNTDELKTSLIQLSEINLDDHLKELRKKYSRPEYANPWRGK